jgi:type II secretory pathway pseudopilin PulG
MQKEKLLPNTTSCWCADKKLPAFTLLELIVGMIVSVIVLAVIFSAYHIVVRQSEQFCSRSTGKRDLSLLHSTYTRDITSCDSVAIISADEVQCYLLEKNNWHLSATYTSIGEAVTRTSAARVDTFFTDSSFTFYAPHAGDQH